MAAVAATAVLLAVAVSLFVVVVPAAATGSQTTEAFDCGSKKLTVWLWPKGNPKGWAGFEKDSAPLAYAFSGWAAPTAITIAAGIHAGIAGVEIGSKCVPKGGKKLQARAVGLVRVSAATQLRCTFPSNPLIQIETLPNSNKRLNLVLAKRLVVTAYAAVTTATLSYTKQYCVTRKR